MAAPALPEHRHSLTRALIKSHRNARWRALLLVAPLLLFLIVTFAVPVGKVLARSFIDDTVPRAAPALTAWFQTHAATVRPDESAYAALVRDLRQMRTAHTAGEVGTRINVSVPGSRSLVTASARMADRLEPPYQTSVTALDARWADPAIWVALRSAASAVTTDYFLSAMDLQRDGAGQVIRVPEGRRIYVAVFGRTLLLSALITMTCILLAFPVSHLLANLPPARSNLLLMLVLLPFWTSLLVRTSSWIVLLQNQGVVNDVLVATGLVSDAHRIQMMYDKVGTIIVMTHVLLPFMILPLYSVMRGINPSYMRAARSLGATSWAAFWRVYVPQALPGISAGSMLVFIMAIGYFVTPALVGGADGQLISNLIQFHMNNSNWALAAALSTMLLACILLLYWVYDRMIGVDNLRLS